MSGVDWVATAIQPHCFAERAARELSEPGLAERLAAAGLYPPERPVFSAGHQALHADLAPVWGPVVREARVTVD